MGTNFYLRGHGHTDDPQYHIGKRSTAGQYCWDCDITLCRKGNSGIHGESSWHDACPKCGKKPREESLSEGAVGRELGFNKSEPKKKSGVSSAASFTWAMPPHIVLHDGFEKETHCLHCGQKFKEEDKIIESEYGDIYTLEEFKQILEECPIRFIHSIGEWFS